MSKWIYGDVHMIATLPPFYKMNYTDAAGKLTAQATMFNDQVFQTLNQLITLVNSIAQSGGITPPGLTTAQISAILPTAKSGTIWFNIDIDQWQGKDLSGLLKTFTVT